MDFHTWQLLKGVGLATLIGVGTQLSIGNDESDLVKALRRARSKRPIALGSAWSSASSMCSRRSRCGRAGRCG